MGKQMIAAIFRRGLPRFRARIFRYRDILRTSCFGLYAAIPRISEYSATQRHQYRNILTRDGIQKWESRLSCSRTYHLSHNLQSPNIFLIMSTFGQYFRVTTYGESHCRSVGCIVDGCPPGMQLDEADIQQQVSRRRPGQSALSTPRNEQDQVHIQSGTENNKTLGTPIGILVNNRDQRPHDYGGATIDLYPRPSHADWTYMQKYGIKASSGGGRSSARETIGTITPKSLGFLQIT